MDALELQAALVKLDPATTVTPIVTTKVSIVGNQHQVNFSSNVTETDLGLQNNAHHNSLQKQIKSNSSSTTTTMTRTKTSSSSVVVVGGNGGCSHNHQPTKQTIKCSIAEKR
ncbi:hypothetical protein QAD02_001254 [Eretmocerus hayati]|uniref:Uncharacterized protein n=1 Tax=Eretmocerus hayati TaxID=131215 RepID=A0ACC2NFQ3_9HYME|nr:hypothetical protein QAD02_001254 [Eretmocerus hayati]